ncbi:MAG: hypothetical protein ABR584_07165 [Candidatus Baltobacteraceae bacterium]
MKFPVRIMFQLTASLLLVGSTAISASAAPRDACALLPLSQVQSVLGAGTTIETDVAPQPRNGAMYSSCAYMTPNKYRTIVLYAVYPSAAAAQGAYGQMQRRWERRGRNTSGAAAVKGTQVLVFGVAEMASRSVNMALSRKLFAAAMGAL